MPRSVFGISHLEQAADSTEPFSLDNLSDGFLLFYQDQPYESVPSIYGLRNTSKHTVFLSFVRRLPKTFGWVLHVT